MLKSYKFKGLWCLRFISDLTAIVAAYYSTILLRFHSEIGLKLFDYANGLIGVARRGQLDSSFEQFYLQSACRIIFILMLVICFLYALLDLYPGKKFIRKRPVAWNITLANMIAIGIFYTYFYLQRNVFHPRSIFLTMISLNIFFCILFRSITEIIIEILRKHFDIDKHRTVLVGKNEASNFLKHLIDTFNPHGIYIVGHIPCNSNEPSNILLKSIRDACETNNADMIILAEESLTISQIMQILDLAASLDLPIKVLSKKIDILVTHAHLPSDIIEGAPLVDFQAPSYLQWFQSPKIIFSVIVAFISLILAIPLMLIIAILIKLTSHGNVFFIQERIGVNRVPFKMYKFRTMHNKAEEAQAQVEEFNETEVGLFKIRNDPRVTPIGRFLRRFSLDELPQLFNVLMGKMTLVGPRPLPRRDFENYYEDWHYSRHLGLPGLTCLWQVSGRSELGFHDMCILDVYYLRNQSFILDIKIIIRTIWVVIFAKGAY